MRNFLTVGEKFCPAKGENVPVQVWWDDEGARQEQCFHHGSCDHQSAFGDVLPPPCVTKPRTV